MIVVMLVYLVSSNLDHHAQWFLLIPHRSQQKCCGGDPTSFLKIECIAVTAGLLPGLDLLQVKTGSTQFAQSLTITWITFAGSGELAGV